jgi:transcriptional regulator with XRE-family HTH domain
MKERKAQILLGRRIKTLQLRQKLTQEALGGRAGLNYKYLGAISSEGYA